MAQTMPLNGKTHKFPKCLFPIFEYLRSLDGVECVGIGPFAHRGHGTDFQVRIKYYNATTRTFKVEVAYKGFHQNFYPRIDPLLKGKIENSIINYRI